MAYKLARASGGIIRLSDSAYIPPAPENKDWQEYQLWKSNGNNPLPADPPTTEEIQAEADRVEEEAQRTALKGNTLFNTFISSTPAQVDTFVASRATNLAGVVSVLQFFGKILLLIARKLARGVLGG